MTKWQRTVRLQPEWGMAARREITAQELAKSIASKVRRVADFPACAHLNEERDFIADEFEDFSAEPSRDFEDLDAIMDRLYGWGDSQIGGEFFNAKKVCWIDTITPPATLQSSGE